MIRILALLISIGLFIVPLVSAQDDTSDPISDGPSVSLSPNCSAAIVDGPAAAENGQRAVFHIQGFAPGELVTVASDNSLGGLPIVSTIRADAECRAEYPSAVYVNGGGVTVALTFTGSDPNGAPLAIGVNYAILSQAPPVPPQPVQARPLPTSSQLAPSQFDFQIVDARVVVFNSGSYHLAGVVQNNGLVDAVPRLSIQAADGKQPTGLEVCHTFSGACSGTRFDNIPAGATQVFSYDGFLTCTTCRFSGSVLPGNDQVAVSVQGVFVR